MAGDPNASFAFELNTKGLVGPAGDAVRQLQQLKERITQDTKALGQMNAALRQMQAGGQASSNSFKILKERVAATKASVSAAQSSFVQLGGVFGDAGKGAESTASGFGTLLEKAKSSGGPLGKLVQLGEGLVKNFGSVLVAAGVIAIAAAFVALAVSIGTAVIALTKYGIASANARRNESLMLEGLTKSRNWYGLAAGKAGDLQSAIDKVAASSSLGRDQIADMTTSLYKAGLRGAALTKGLEAVSLATAAGGESQGAVYRNLAISAGLYGGSIAKVADDAKARFGGIVARQMLSLDVQQKKLHESFAALFSDLKLEKLLAGLNQVTALFSQNTATGRALKVLFTTMIQPLIDAMAAAGPLAKRFFQGVVIGALLLAIGILKVRNIIRNAFGDKKIFGGIDGMRVAMFLGMFTAALFAAGLFAVIAAFGILGAMIASVLVPVYMIGKALWGLAPAAYGMARALFQIMFPIDAVKGSFTGMVDFIKGIDWAALGTAIIQGLVNGLLSAPGLIGKAAMSIGKQIESSLRHALDSHSPSRLAFRIGVSVPQGLAGGELSGLPMVHAASVKLADPVSAMSSEFSLPTGGPPRPTGGSAPAAARGPLVHIQELHVGGGDAKKAADDFITQLEQALRGSAVAMGAI